MLYVQLFKVTDPCNIFPMVHPLTMRVELNEAFARFRYIHCAICMVYSFFNCTSQFRKDNMGQMWGSRGFCVSRNISSQLEGNSSAVLARCSHHPNWNPAVLPY